MATVLGRLNAIQDAMLARLKDKIPTLKTTSRRLLNFNEIRVYPALAVLIDAGNASTMPDMPSKWSLQSELVFYVRVPKVGQDWTPETLLLSLLEQAENALERQDNENTQPGSSGTTLGGLVSGCAISGFEVHHGTGEDLAAATLSIEMLAKS